MLASGILKQSRAIGISRIHVSNSRNSAVITHRKLEIRKCVEYPLTSSEITQHGDQELIREERKKIVMPKILKSVPLNHSRTLMI